MLVEAGAAIDAVPRAEDGSERAPSLAGLAVDMRRGYLVSLLAKALVDRDASETWAAEWTATTAAAADAADSAVAADSSATADAAVAAVTAVTLAADAGAAVDAAAASDR